MYKIEIKNKIFNVSQDFVSSIKEAEEYVKYILSPAGREEALNVKKIEVKNRVSVSKKVERAKGLKVGIHTFFSTPTDLQKYDHAMKTGKRIAKAKDIAWEDFKGKVKVQEGLVEVTGAEFDVALGAIDIFLYKTWYKEQLLHGAVDACSTVEEVEAINWE